MKNLLTTYQDAQKKKIAVGHFNVSDLWTLKGIVAAAKDLQVPVVVGVSRANASFSVIGKYRLWSQASAMAKDSQSILTPITPTRWNWRWPPQKLASIPSCSISQLFRSTKISGKPKQRLKCSKTSIRRS